MPPRSKKPKTPPPPTDEEIEMKQDSDNFTQSYVQYLETLLENPVQNPHIVNLPKIFKKLWETYPAGLSYFMNYYINTNKVDDYIDHFLVAGFYAQFLEHFIDEQMQSIEFNTRLSSFNTIMESKYDYLWLGFELCVFDLVVDNKLLYGKVRTTKDQLDLLIRFFIASFGNSSIASVVRAGSPIQVVYRGIVGLTIDDRAKLLKKTKSFTSTSKQLDVAMKHTTTLTLSRKQNDLTKKVILEMHLDPNIPFVDYNALIPNDSTNAWQHEVILPPGLHLEELGTKKMTETIKVVDTGNPSQKSKQTRDAIYECDILVVRVSAHPFSSGGTRYKK